MESNNLIAVHEDDSAATKLNLTKSVVTASSTIEQNQFTSADEDDEQVFVKKERYWVLFLFGFCMMANGCGTIAIAPIFLLVEYVYDVQPLIINLMSYSFMALYVPVNFPSVYIVDKYGLRVGTLIGISLTTFGICIRCLVN